MQSDIQIQYGNTVRKLRAQKNLSQEDFVIADGERIAQMVIAKHEQGKWEEVEVLDETERGDGGYGHTGVK